MKLRYTFLYLLLISATTLAQNRPDNQEFTIGAGCLTSEQMFDGTYVGVLVPTMKQYTNSSASGIYFVNYKYYVSKKVTIGFMAGVEKESGDWYYDDMSGKPDDWNSYRIGTFTRTAYTIAPEISFAYLNDKNVRIYSTVGIGATFKHEYDTYDIPAAIIAKAIIRVVMLFKQITTGILTHTIHLLASVPKQETILPSHWNWALVIKAW